MFKTALVYGALSGVFIIGVIVLGVIASGQQFGDKHLLSSQWLGYLVMIVALSMIFLAVRDHRNKKLGGVIKFLPAFGMGVLIAAIAGLFYVVSWEIYLAATNYTFMNNYIAQTIEARRAAGVTGAELEAYAAQMNQMREAYANPLFRMPMTFAEIFPVGLLIALISALVLRNPKVLPARA